jgi:hypothetical protein
MSGVDVGDLVSDHAGQLGLIIGEREQAARDEDVTAGQRERVGLGHVDDRKAVAHVRARCVAREALSNRVDVRDELRILDEADLLRHPPRLVSTDLLLAFGRVEDQLAARRRRDGRAAGNREGEREQRDDVRSCDHVVDRVPWVRWV